jgi:hypothetical protein
MTIACVTQEAPVPNVASQQITAADQQVDEVDGDE